MKASRCLTLALTFTLLLAVSSHADQTIPDNLIVNGWVDADGNSISFGTQGATFGAALLHADSNTDTFTFLSNRNPASWLWLHSAAVAAMRLDSAHQLILYQADGTTAGLTFAPASNSIKLGSHANGTLTADANGVITAGGGFTVAGNFTNTSGTLTGSASAFTSLSVNGSSTFGVTNTLTGSVETFAFLAPNAGDGNQVYGFLGLARATGKSAVLDFYAGTAGAAYADSFFALGLYGENPANSFKLSAGGALTLGGTITGQGQLNLNSAGAPSLSQQNNKINLTGQGTGVDGIYMANTTGTFVVGIEGSAGNQVGVNTSAYDAVIGTIGAKKIDFITNNTVRAVIDSAGNVGIGTTSPEAKLDVAGVVNIPANTWFTGNGNGLLRDSYFGYSSSYRAIQIGSQLGSETGNSQAIALGIDPATITGGAFFGDEIALPNQVEFMQANSGKTDWIQNVLVLNNGNVGIGTSNPSAKLHIYSTGQPEVALESSSRKWSMFSNEGWANGGLGFYNYNSGATALYIGPGNNVGIGTTNPSALLDVYGSLGSTRVSGNQITHVYNAEANPRWQIDRDAGGSGLAGIKFGSGGVSALDTTIARISGGGISVTGGNVGIGTTNPGSKLELSSIAQTVLMITGDSDNAGGDAGYTGITLSWAGAEKWNIGPAGTGGNGLVFRRGGSSNDVIIDATGNVGIGTTSPTHKLAVNGTIRAKEVIVDTGWADYVFEDDYRLAPLAEVESHIKAKKHLPGIPSASEVAEHGVSMGDMQARLLSKIEEITLHQIAQEKQMIAQQKLLAEQSNRLSAQSTRIERLEQENRQLRAQTTTP